MNKQPKQLSGSGHANPNIALIKYWGKRDEHLNLPMTSSLSVNVPNYHANTTLIPHDQAHDIVSLNDAIMPADSSFHRRIVGFLNLYRDDSWHCHIECKTNMPIAAGLASSAAGFAALTFALNDLMEWNLDKKTLSTIARRGSGSASRSIFDGFVEWHAGDDDASSYAEPLPYTWPGLCLGVVMVNDKEKTISSRQAMRDSVNTAPGYAHWTATVRHDMHELKAALQSKDFEQLGETAERNALAMHQLMIESTPVTDYSLPATHTARQTVQQLRTNGVPVYFTQDAGPNLKLLFEQAQLDAITAAFPELIVCELF